MRAGMPRRNHGAQHGRKRDRSRTDRPLYRLRALRRRVSHRFGDPQRLPAAARTHRRYQPSTRTGAGFGADPLAALEPRADEALQRIVEAARYAPTASNSRQVSFTLVTEPEQLRRIADFTVGVFASTARKLLHPVVRTLLKPLRPDLYRYAARFAEIEREHEAGNDPILRRATALLIIHTPASNRFGCEDANLAYQNASLMAESLGVSQIYMGFVLTAARMGRKNAFARIAGITGRPQAIMALGIPAFRYSKYTER